MRKIAILKISNSHHEYDNFDKVVDRITDFEEVSDGDFELLNKAQYEMGFSVIEMPVNQKDFIQNTVAEYLLLLEKRAKVKRQVEELSRKKNEEVKKKKRLLLEVKQRKDLEIMLKNQVASGNITKEDADKILSSSKSQSQ